ncbi:MAG: DUF952 domain-containing protein [Acidimicrobiales bacterium]
MLLHIISQDELAAARACGEISPPSLDSEGFVHCSYPEQVLIPANERFRGRENLVLLSLDTELIRHPLVVEDSYGSGTSFPHVYGPIPVEAIEQVIDFPTQSDGTFVLPPMVQAELEK